MSGEVEEARRRGERAVMRAEGTKQREDIRENVKRGRTGKRRRMGERRREEEGEGEVQQQPAPCLTMKSPSISFCRA
eukprot:492393-Hanusia_phi.AAC.1